MIVYPRETPPHTRTARAQPPAAHRRRHSRPHHRRHGEHSPTTRQPHSNGLCYHPRRWTQAQGQRLGKRNHARPPPSLALYKILFYMSRLVSWPLQDIVLCRGVSLGLYKTLLLSRLLYTNQEHNLQTAPLFGYTHPFIAHTITQYYPLPVPRPRFIVQCMPYHICNGGIV